MISAALDRKLDFLLLIYLRSTGFLEVINLLLLYQFYKSMHFLFVSG